jgi:hypothetical protein
MNSRQILADLGVAPGGSVRQAARRFKVLIADFSATINAGAQADASVQVDAGWLFVVDAIVGTIFTPTARTMIAGTPFAREGDPAIADGTSSQFDHFRLQIRDGEATWFNTPIRAGIILGDGRLPNYLRFSPVVAGNDTLTVSLFNDSPADAARAQIAFIGRYIRE